MSKTPDKRRRTDLDLFVLALVDSGVATPYELQKAAGISQGASVPALQRLLDAGFIRQGKPGLRGRTDYRATAAGSKALKIGWRRLIDGGPSGDLDANLRVALLALWVGGDRRPAARFLSQAADGKIEYLNSIEQRDDLAQVTPLARWYSSLRLTAAKTLLEAESNDRELQPLCTMDAHHSDAFRAFLINRRLCLPAVFRSLKQLFHEATE
jgi:DNA-binding PadR family transcriptional regulator